MCVLAAVSAQAESGEDERVLLDRDRQALNTCIVAAQSVGAATSCTLLTVEDCQARIDGEASHASASVCFTREREIWRDLYEAEVVELMRWASAFDADAASLGGSWGTAREDILRAEAAWTEFREAECQMEVVHYSTGNAGMVDQPSCDIRLLAERVHLLRSLTHMRLPDAR